MVRGVVPAEAIAGYAADAERRTVPLGYVIVVLLAGSAGALVYWASMRYSAGADAPERHDAPELTPREEGAEVGAAGEGGPAPAAPPGTAYIPVVRSRGSWQSRLGGVMGLAIAVAVGAATTAFVLYEAGHIITKLLTDAANNG
jgi:hypothetical protein